MKNSVINIHTISSSSSGDNNNSRNKYKTNIAIPQ